MGINTAWRRALVFLGCGAVLMLVICVALGSRSGSPKLIERSARPASRIFEGFAYAGQDLPHTIDAVHVSRLLPFRIPVQSIPEDFVQGHTYFFHHPLPADAGMRIAQEILAPRLSSEGFTLTQGAPANGIFFRGFATWELRGGDGITQWAIQFRRDKCVGIIGYTNDQGIRENPWPVVRGTWDPADYALTIEGTCNL
jgi:hypothetical protein